MIPFTLKKLLVRTGIARFLPAVKRLTDGNPEFLRYYSDRILAAPVEELRDPALCPQLSGPDTIHLNLAAPRFDSPVTGGRVSADRRGMPDTRGMSELREAIAERLSPLRDPETEVLVTRGATGAFSAVLDAFVNPGDRVVLLNPCSPLFTLGARSRRAKVRFVPSPVKIDELIAAMRGAKLLALANPNNPDGTMLSPEAWEQIALAAEQYDVLVYVDRTFERFQFEDAPFEPFRNPEFGNRLLLADSVTGSDGLGSLRVGWLSGCRPLIRACTLTAALSGPGVPTLCQQAALRAVRADEELFGPVLEEFRARRRFAQEKLTAMGFTVSPPSGGYFFWIPVENMGLNGRQFAERLFAEQKVLVGPGELYGPGGTNFIRLSIAEEDGRLREGLARMATFVRQLKGEPEPVRVEKPREAIAEQEPAFSRS